MGNIFRRGKRRREFISALSERDIKRVQKLTRYGTEEDKEDGLWTAAGRGHLEVVRYFVEQWIEAWQDSALRKAARRGDRGIEQYLAERCDAYVIVSKALVEAASRGHVNVVQYLAERCGADVNAKDDVGRRALIEAASFDHIEVVRYLVEQCGVDVSANALAEGASHGRLNVVRYFVEQCGVDVDMEDEYGQTAGIEAIKNREIDVVRYLVEECSADVNSTAVRLAANRGDTDIQRILTPFLRPEVEDTTKDSGDIALLSGIPSNCFIPPSEIELTLFHENGSIGGDFLAKWLGSDVVVKLPIPDASFASFMDEVRLWQQLRHPKVLKMYGACDAGRHLKFFVCEYASSGSLLEHVNLSSAKKTEMWKYLHEAALGLEYLHERGIVHAELRCSNILIGSDGSSKLANFRLSGLRSSASTRTLTAGSVRWQSPEVIAGYPPSCESDVYSLGMCILEAATGKMPWSTEKDELFVRIHKNAWTPEDDIGKKYSYYPGCPPGDVGKLVHEICCKDPRLRPSLSAVVYKLGNLAIKESSDSNQPENEPVSSFDEYERGSMKEAWLQLETLIA